jgi:hypothetical protein
MGEGEVNRMAKAGASCSNWWQQLVLEAMKVVSDKLSPDSLERICLGVPASVLY